MSPQNLSVHAFDSHALRVIDLEGEPWFVATDVASVLGYRNAPDMTRMLDEDEAGTHEMRIRSENGVEQMREVTVLSESGLYACILKSQRPEARAFRKWVTATVLPAVRKTGSYVSGEEHLDPTAPDYMERLHELLLEAKERKIAAQAAEIEALTPKADDHDKRFERVDLVGRDIELVATLVRNEEVVPLDATDGPLDHALVLADTVLVVHDVAAGLQVFERARGLTALAGAGSAVGASAAGEVRFGDDRHLGVGKGAAPVEGSDHDLARCGPGVGDAGSRHREVEAVVEQQVVEALGRSGAVGGDHDSVSLADQVDHVHAKAVDAFFKPIVHHVVNLSPELRILPIQVRLFFRKVMKIVSIGLFFIFPGCPGFDKGTVMVSCAVKVTVNTSSKLAIMIFIL